jgi:hypothetical protein
MKKLYLLLLLVMVLTGCSISQTAYEFVKENITAKEIIADDEPVEIVEVEIDSEIEEVDVIVEDVEEVIPEEFFEPIKLIEDGAEITLLNVNKKFIGNNLNIIYNFTGKDLLREGEDVLNWKAYVYITRNNLVEIPYCTANQISSTEWVSTHCMDKKIYDGYGSNIHIIYTNRPSGDLDDRSHVKLDNLDKVFVFDPVNP